MIDFKEEIAKKIAEVVQLDKNELMQYIESDNTFNNKSSINEKINKIQSILKG